MKKIVTIVLLDIDCHTNSQTKSDKFGYTGQMEIVNGGFIVLNYKKYNKIYDFLGNIVTEIPTGVNKAFISPDGKSVFYQYDSSFQILDISNNNLIMNSQEKFNFINVKLSDKGKYIVGLGKPTKEIPENIIFINTQKKTFSKIKIEGDVTERNLSRPECFWQRQYIMMSLRKDGKYLFVVNAGSEPMRLFYYQLF